MPTLEQKVDSIEQKQRDFERSEEVDEAVETADRRLQRHNDRLSDLEDDVEELVHRHTVVTDVYGRTEAQSVGTARSRLTEVVETTQDDILSSLDTDDLGSEAETVRDVEEVVESAVSDSKSRLTEVQQKWVGRVSTAESILRIIGTDSNTMSLLDDIESFVRHEAWKLSKRTGRLENEWSGLTAKWDETRIDWETFQAEHGLSDETIALLKRLADDETPSLSSTRAEVVEELFDVQSLRKNVDLTI